MTTNHETTLAVPDMTCGLCVRHVGDALRRVPGVAGVEVDLRARTARVRHDPGVAPTPDLIAALDRAGYAARAA